MSTGIMISKKRDAINDADFELKNKLIQVVNSDKSFHDILVYIQNEINENTRVTGFNYKIKCFREDGAYALSRAVETVYGYTSQANSPGPSGGRPPVMIDIAFADGTHKKVPFGKVNLAGLGEDAYIEMDYDVDNKQLVLKGQCERRFQTLMDTIIEETKRLVTHESIYRGKAVKITSLTGSPEFINLSNIDKTPIFLTPDAKFATQPIEARIEHTQNCIDRKIDLRYGVLLEGNYGTGKTLYAFKLAKKAIENGWSFIYCPDSDKTLYVMEIANMLSSNGRGVVLFLEDIDKVLNKRTEATNKISLLMDGGETKNKNVITILTTNHLENIDPTFLRGKRIGSIVSLTHPDKATALEMIKKTLVNDFDESLLSDDCDEAAGMIEDLKIVPAFIAEILDRVKSHMIYSRKETVSCEDIINSIKSYRVQMQLATARKAESTVEQRLVATMREALFDPFKEEIKEMIDDIS